MTIKPSDPHHYQTDKKAGIRRDSRPPHNQFAADYLAEIRQLGNASSLPEFENFIHILNKYPEYLASKRCILSPIDLILDASNGTGIIEVASSDNDDIRNALYLAHTAACCHLLHSSHLARRDINPSSLNMMAQNFLHSCENAPDDYVKRIIGKFHTMDTMRMVHFLRILGLLSRLPNEICQLGLGVGSGTRDVISAHMDPRITISTENNQMSLGFYADQHNVKDIVIVDSDPTMRDLFRHLNEDTTRNIYAINESTDDALQQLERKLTIKRNLITAFRIEHRMMPDIELLMKRLSRCISEDCDLIISIGSGDTIQDYCGRIEKIAELYSWLSNADLQPAIFKFHDAGNVDTQWASLKFGSPSSSSYQLFYCKVSASALSQ